MLTEMNSAGLSSICQGTNGLNGSALRAIFSTFGPLLALGWVVAVCGTLGAGAHAPISSAATTAPMTGHRVVSENIRFPSRTKTIQVPARDVSRHAIMPG